MILWLLIVHLLAQAPAPDSSAERLLAVAMDSSGHASPQGRATALQALGRSCPREAVPALVALAQPYRREWVIWHSALAALSACPYEELAPFWRDMITFPKRPVREVAIVGLLRTGAPGDITIIRDATHRETDSLIVRLAERADSVLRLPLERRGAALKR